MRRPKYRLSPNEVERLVKEDREQRRKLRIVQVREQAKANAAAIRNDVRRAREKLLDDFAAEIKEQLEAEKEEKIRKMEQSYENTLRTVGEGHREAHLHGDGESRAEKLQKQRENNLAAEKRYREALEQHRIEQAVRDYEQNKHISARQAALERERDRAAEIAALPPPPPDISVELEKSTKRAIPMVDMQAFATTHYHIPEYHVVKADSEEQLYDAKLQAKDSDLKLKQDLEERKRSQHERIERARIRGNQALQKEMLKHHLGDMLKDLSLLQKQDRRRRQAVLADIPKQVFIPPESCMEEREERQREMERKFDEMYMKQHRLDNEEVKSFDVSDYPTNQDSVTGSGQDSSVTPDAPIPMSRINPALRDLTNVPRPGEDTQTGKPETVLKQLLSRIKDQRVGRSAGHTIATNHKTASEVDSQSLVSAESRADWQQTEQGGEDPYGLGQIYLQAGHSEMEVGSADQGDNVKIKIRSDLDADAMSTNDQMIEELKRRIELIESQKEKLAQQYRAQNSFHRHLMAETELHNQEVEEGESLREVDIETTRDSEMDTGGDCFRDRNFQTRGLPSEETSPSADLKSAAANLKPVTGILKGVRNTQFELITSNGFLPAPEMSVAAWQMERSEVDQDRGRPDTGMFRLNEVVRPANEGDPGGRMVGFSAQREINFHTEPQETLPRLVGFPGESGRYDGGDFSRENVSFSQLQGQSLASQGSSQAMAYLGYGTSGPLSRFDDGGGDFQRTEKQAEMMMLKVKEYTERAGERQVGIDAETLQKVREYQQRLVETHEDRKKLLADVRADIAKRRQELFTSKSGSAGGLENWMVNLDKGEDLTVPGKMDVETRGTAENRGYREWEPIQPFRADRGRTVIGPHMAVPSQVRTKMLTSGTSQFSSHSGQICEPGGRVDGPTQTVMADTKSPRGAGREKVDRIRKSLSFEDAEESMNISRGSWRDVLNDTATSKHSHMTTDDSRLSSSEEERGSPVLPHSRSSKSELSDKSANSVTGSSSLNGSALVARAEERRMGFERRQEELHQQLMDIQRQKDDILQRYYDGQKALQQQQAALRSKLATASSAAGSDNGDKQRAQVRAKLAEVKSHVGTEGSVAASWLYGGERRHNQATAGLTHGAVGAKSGTGMNESVDSEGTNARLSAGSNGTPGNLSSDSYLAEISYHKIQSVNDKSLPSSMFETRNAGSQPHFPMPKPAAADGTPGIQTWASLLTSSSARQQLQETSSTWQPQTGGHSESGQEDGFSSFESIGQSGGLTSTGKLKSSLEDTRSSGDKSWSSDSVGESQEPARESYLPPPLSTHPPLAGLADHQPHELSTILEVDTPTSSSAVASVRRGTTATNSNTVGTNLGSSATTLNSQSLSSLGSSSDVRMDVFHSLPYTFPEGKAAKVAQGGAVFDLSSANQSKWADYLSAETAAPTLSVDTRAMEPKQMKAKRSLDFSEGAQTEGQGRRQFECLSSEEDLFATAMPALVELTPLRPTQRWGDIERREVAKPDRVSSVPDLSAGDESSSLAISGYSDYLLQTRGHQSVDGEKGGNQQKTGDDVRYRAVGGDRGCDNNTGQTEKISEVLQHA